VIGDFLTPEITKVRFILASLLFLVGLEKITLFYKFIISKTKTNCQLLAHVFAFNSDWFVVLLIPAVICQIDHYFC